jgi:hypothetical protein
VDINRDYDMGCEMKHRMSERDSYLCLEEDAERRGLVKGCERSMREGIVAPTLLYDSEAWTTGAVERRLM